MQFNRFAIATTAMVLFAAPLGALAATGDPAAPPPPVAAGPTPSVQLTPQGDIIDTLKASGQFTILVKALDATNLTSVLRRPGPFTILAPTDAAFNALPPATLDSLMKPENASQLQALLIYHVINTAVPLAKIQGTKGAVKTVAGRDVEIDGSGATVKFNDALVEGQAAVSNGDIYVIGQVLTESTAAAAATNAGAAASATTAQ